MKILAALEGLLHHRVPRDAGQQPQLDLGVVGVDQQGPFGREEKAAQLAAAFGPHRNILQVRFDGADPPGSRFGLAEDRPNPVIGVDLRPQTVDIGGFQLGKLPVGKDILDDRMVFPQGVEGVGVGGKAAFGLFAGWKSKPLKKHLSQLLGGVDVEFPTREEINPSGQFGDVGVKLPSVFNQALLV